VPPPILQARAFGGRAGRTSTPSRRARGDDRGLDGDRTTLGRGTIAIGSATAVARFAAGIDEGPAFR